MHPDCRRLKKIMEMYRLGFQISKDIEISEMYRLGFEISKDIEKWHQCTDSDFKIKKD